VIGKEESLKEYVFQRVRGMYIILTYRPDLLFVFVVIAQYHNPGPTEFKTLNNVLTTIIKTP